MGPAPRLRSWRRLHVLRRRRQRRRWEIEASAPAGWVGHLFLLRNLSGSGSSPACWWAVALPRVARERPLLFISGSRLLLPRPPIRPLLPQYLESDPFSLVLLIWSLITHIETLKQWTDSCPLAKDPSYLPNCNKDNLFRPGIAD